MKLIRSTLLAASLSVIGLAGPSKAAIGPMTAPSGKLVSPASSLLDRKPETQLLQVAQSNAQRHQYRDRRYLGRRYEMRRERGYRWRRHYDRTPGHYTYRDFPSWAARAFEPARTR